MSAFASHVLMPAQCPDDVIAAVVAAMPQLSPEHVATVYAKLIRAAGTPPPADPAALPPVEIEAALTWVRGSCTAGMERHVSTFENLARLHALYESESDRTIDPADMPLAEFLRDVRDEAKRARGLFPGDTLRTLAFSEEAGELVKAVLDESPERVRREAVQAAAMAARIALDGDGSVVEWRKAKGLAPL